MNKSYRVKNFASILFSTVLSFIFVFAVANAASTISTNISTGGTLTVTGTTALDGGLTMDTDKFTVANTTGNTVVGGTFTVTGTSALNETVTIAASKGLVLGSSSSNLTGSAGMIFYDSTNKAIKLYDGSSWFTVGTTTTGVQLSGNRVSLGDLTTQYMTIGTTTQTGLSVMTLTGTTTTSIPLTIRGATSQAANLFQLQNIGGTELFALDFAGNASSTMLSTTGNIWVNGYATTTGSNGNFATEGTLTVGGTAAVTGATTLTGALTANGAVTLGNAS